MVHLCRWLDPRVCERRDARLTPQPLAHTPGGFFVPIHEPAHFLCTPTVMAYCMYNKQTQLMTFIPESLKQIDFLVQATGDIYNPTGIITPITEAAFEYVHDSGLEFVSYNITDANGYCVSRQDFEQYVEIIEDHFSVFLYHPEYGVAELEAV